MVKYLNLYAKLHHADNGEHICEILLRNNIEALLKTLDVDVQQCIKV